MRTGLVALAVAALLAAASPLAAQIRINEVLASNLLGRADEDGDFGDWIELVNVGPLALSLEGSGLTDDPRIPFKWIFPEVRLAPDQYLVVWCSGKNLHGAELHTSFRLSGSGERVELVTPAGSVADAVVFPAQTDDHSWGRTPDRTGDWRYLLRPTPGRPNDVVSSETPISSLPDVTPGGGVYAEPPVLEISGDFPPGVVIRFAINGSPPNADSQIYRGPLAVQRTSVLRAAAFLDRDRVSVIATHTYLVGVDHLEVPIMAISMTPSDFEFVHLSNQNRGRQFERGGHLEIFNEAGQRVASSPIGLRLHGGAGRSGGLALKKSYRAYFRREYGNAKLDLPLFADTEVRRFDKLVLRAGMADAFRSGPRASLIRDQVVRNLHRDMGHLIAHGTWYNLFVNSRYRGLYNVSERIGADFFASYFPGTDDDDWDVVAAFADAIDGDKVAWEETVRFFKESDLNDEALFEEAIRRVDVENLTTYVITNMWAQNHDWPSNNWFAAAPRGHDIPWQFVVWDAESGLGWGPTGHSADSFEHFFLSGNRGGNLSDVFVSLFARRDFQRYFLETFDELLGTVLSADHVIGLVREQADVIDGDIEEEAAATSGDAREWASNIEAIIDFAKNRGSALRQAVFESGRFTLPRAVAVDPRRVRLLPETVVVVEGRNLERDARIFFNDVPSPSVEFISSVAMRAALPFDLAVAGNPDITVEHEGFRLTARGLLRVDLARPRIVNLQPDRGSGRGGDEVLISGINFLEGVTVLFGETPAPSVERFFDTDVLLRVITPPGSGTVEVRVVNTIPGEVPSETTLPFTYVPAGEARFLRGDINGDRRVTITDAIAVLDVLFRDPAPPACLDAGDADDSGRVDLTDAIALLDHLFRGGGPLPQPSGACGVDLTADSLPCARPVCE